MATSGNRSVPENGSQAHRGDPTHGLAIHHVLIPLDGSALAECAVPFAATMAAPFSARITLLRVLKAPGAPVDPVEWELRRAEARRNLDRIRTQLLARQLGANVELLEGRPAEQIIEFAKHNQVDLTVLSSHGEGGLSGWALSSTIQKVLARAETSILIVPAYCNAPVEIGELHLSKILVPLDCSPRAECTLPLAVSLARAHQAKLLLAHVVSVPEMPRRMPASQEDIALAERLTERNRVEAERYLAELRERLVTEGVTAETRLVVSPQKVRSIDALADAENVDLVLVAAHGCSGDQQVRYGSVAGRLPQECSKPVMIVQDLSDAARVTTAVEEAARGHPGH